jgi:hypothetical protein
MTKRVLGNLQMHTLMSGQKLPPYQRKFPVRPIDLGHFGLIGRSPKVLIEASVSIAIVVFYLLAYQRKRHGEESKELYGRHWI